MKTSHEWVDKQGTLWQASDYGCIVYLADGKWVSPLDTNFAAHAEILRLAGALEDATTWMPIETAPRDGTWILVWEADYDCPMSAQWGLLNINPNKYDGVHGWSGYGYIFSDVTHWMPMPAMPLEQSDTPKKHQNSDTTDQT